MIFEGILTVFKWIALCIISLIPKFPDYSSFLSTSLSPMFDVINTTGSFVDLTLLMSCLLILFVVHNIEFIFSCIMWIVRKIPGVS